MYVQDQCLFSLLPVSAETLDLSETCVLMFTQRKVGCRNIANKYTVLNILNSTWL